METLLKTDIFFFITSVAVVAVTICVIYAMYHLIRILRNVDEISGDMREEGELIREDISDLRENVRAEGLKVKHISEFIGKFTGTSPRKNPHHKKTE